MARNDDCKTASGVVALRRFAETNLAAKNRSLSRHRRCDSRGNRQQNVDCLNVLSGNVTSTDAQRKAVGAAKKVRGF